MKKISTDEIMDFDELEYLTEEKYENFLKRVNYDAKAVVGENNEDISLNPKEFFLRQFNKICEASSDNKMTGCCLNFSSCLLTKYHGMLLTCKDWIVDKNGKLHKGIHVAFVYPNANGEFFVCDPALAKIYKDDNYFGIPLKEYSFNEEEQIGGQVYRLLPNLRRDTIGYTEDGKEIKFFQFLLGSGLTKTKMSDINDEDINDFKKALKINETYKQ